MAEELKSETVEQIERVLRYMSGIIKNKGREILTNFPITPPQFVALQWLREEGNMTIGELSNKMYLAFSTTTDLIDRMEKNQLVERVRDQKDRRVVNVHLLEKGEKIICEVLATRRNYLADILSHFSHEEVEQMEVVLTKLYQEMENNESK